VALVVLGVMLGLGALVAASLDGTAEAAVALGAADHFGVLADRRVTNTGPTLVTLNLGRCATPGIGENPFGEQATPSAR
jgi:hypothetical protein